MTLDDIADGTECVARTYPNPELGDHPEDVRGPLLKCPLPAYVQCFVGGVLVDPATVRPATDSAAVTA